MRLFPRAFSFFCRASARGTGDIEHGTRLIFPFEAPDALSEKSLASHYRTVSDRLSRFDTEERHM
jgi:hypothetical protein